MACSEEVIHNDRMQLGWQTVRHRPVTVCSLLLVLVAMMDAAWTIYAVTRGFAVEANPFMARVLEHGAPTFVSVKLVYTLPLIVVCEWLREFRPQFALNALRFALFAYLAVYIVGEIKLHHLM